MSDSTGNPLSAQDVGQAIEKGKEYAREHPDQARGAIDKVEDMVDEATGGRFKDMVDKGGALLEQQLGIPQDQAQAPTPTPQPPSGGQQPPAPSDPTQPDPTTPSQPDPTSPTEPGPTTPSQPDTPGQPTPAPAPGETPTPGEDADPTTGTGTTGPAQDGGVLGSDREWNPDRG